MPTKSTASKIKPPTARQYERSAIELALFRCPEIIPCERCQWPRVKGERCTHCDPGDT